MVRSTAHPRLPAGLGSPAVLVTDLQGLQGQAAQAPKGTRGLVQREERAAYTPQSLKTANTRKPTWRKRTGRAAREQTQARRGPTPGWRARGAHRASQGLLHPGHTRRAHRLGGGGSRAELYSERRTCPGGERRAGSRGRLVLTWGDTRRLTWAAQGPPGQTRARVSRGV